MPLQYTRRIVHCIFILSVTTEFVCQGLAPTRRMPFCQQQQRAVTSQRRVPFQHSSSSRISHSFLSNDSSSSRAENEQLTGPKIAELVDVSFVQACLQLADGYVDVLKLMIAAVQSAYVQSMAPNELIRDINALSSPAAGRPLLPEEEQLRNEWIQIVYIMLRELNYKGTQHAFVLDPVVVDTFGKVAPVLIRRRQLSTDWNGNDMWDATGALFPPGQPKALTLQSLRVMWVTLAVVEDVERCEGEFAKMDAPLAPPIPGAFDNDFLA